MKIYSKDSMKNILMYVAVTLMCVGIVSNISDGYHTIREKLKTKYNPAEYGDTGALANIDEQSCLSTGDSLGFKVFVVYEEENGDYVGQWRPKTNTIALVEGPGTDIDTVAHEVHHMVDTMMKRYHVEDDHVAAYLQGTFTACVWKLVVNRNPNFRFSTDL